MSVELVRTIIVEDDPMVMEVNRQFIEATGGFEIVGLANTGTEALELISSLKPHLVILDIFLPDLGGLETLAEIRRRNEPVDVILVTAARDSETIKNVFRYGAIDYIVKPFKFERFKTALQSYQTLRNTLNKDSLDQEEIDRLSSGRATRDTEEETRKDEFSKDKLLKDRLPEDEVPKDHLPKGLTEITLKQILIYLLRQTEPQSAEEVAEGVGIARVTARRYLEFLEKIGKVNLAVQYGSVGRPVNRYLFKH
ncbi:MAG TPA: response regulator [Bacillota bacterium]|nr:response regulator [Bacillota bacterium]